MTSTTADSLPPADTLTGVYTFRDQVDAAQFALGYTRGREDEAGYGPRPSYKGANAFAVAYGRAWQRHKQGRVEYLPSVGDAWANWYGYDGEGVPPLYRDEECRTCGTETSDAGSCPRERCMTLAQESALIDLCGRFGAPFKPEDVAYRPFGLPEGYVMLTVNPTDRPYTVGVAPDGAISS